MPDAPREESFEAHAAGIGAIRIVLASDARDALRIAAIRSIVRTLTPTDSLDRASVNLATEVMKRHD